MTMKTRAAVLHGPHTEWEITELDLDAPRAGEVLIRYEAAGLCHSDQHVQTGDITPRFPLVGGHEGAGVIEAVGPDVTTVAPGDHVVCAFIPACGHCRFCSTGHQNLCDLGFRAMTGDLPAGGFRMHRDGEDYGGFSILGTFSQWGTVSEHSVVRIEKDIPLDVAALVSCGVPTGWGSAVYAAKVRPGETVVVYGTGGIGINAVQGARHAGAKNVVAVDPVAFKREKAEELGATHSAGSAEEAQQLVWERLEPGVGADHAIVTAGVVDETIVRAAFDMVRKGGQVTVTGLGNGERISVQVPGSLLTLWERRIVGSLFGSANPVYDIPRLLDLYRAGDLRLDELITRRYRLEEINQGYQDMLDGRNVRGVIVHEH
jgi:S-(hydroxymethyl)glutathione dehydrogenase/alcohol dehydrogenase